MLFLVSFAVVISLVQPAMNYYYVVFAFVVLLQNAMQNNCFKKERNSISGYWNFFFLILVNPSQP